MTPCPHPLVTHRITDPAPGHPRRRLYECADLGCAGRPEDHQQHLPCRWSGALAHGKTTASPAFPRRRCPACEHIPRAARQDLAAPTPTGTTDGTRLTRAGTRGR
jgi:hypothetical protein